MPYTEKQNKLFRAAAHDPKIAKAHGMTTTEAKKLASEGVKKKVPWHVLLLPKK
jgi:hypothetical protein